MYFLVQDVMFPEWCFSFSPKNQQALLWSAESGSLSNSSTCSGSQSPSLVTGGVVMTLVFVSQGQWPASLNSSFKDICPSQSGLRKNLTLACTSWCTFFTSPPQSYHPPSWLWVHFSSIKLNDAAASPKDPNLPSFFLPWHLILCGNHLDALKSAPELASYTQGLVFFPPHGTWVEAAHSGDPHSVVPDA